MAFKTRIKTAPELDEMDLSTTITLGQRLAFRTASAIDRINNTQYFYVAHFNPETGSYEKRKAEYPLTQAEVDLLKKHEIKGLKATSDEKRLNIDNRFARAVEKGFRNTGFLEMAEELLYFDDEAQIGYKSCIALPEELQQKEREILGTFHIRRYLIEEGFIATKPDFNIVNKSVIIPLEELRNNAFDPRIVTDLDAQEWLFAGQRVSNITPADPIYVLNPYDDISLTKLDDFLKNQPVSPQKTDRDSILGNMQAVAQQTAEERQRQEEEAAQNAQPTLSAKEQNWIFTALLSEAIDQVHSRRGYGYEGRMLKERTVEKLTPEWLKLMKEHYHHDLQLTDLADANGPLGCLLYASVGEYGNKYAFEALPVLIDYFEDQGTPIPVGYLTQTSLGGVTLYERIRAAGDELNWDAKSILTKIEAKSPQYVAKPARLTP